MPKENQVLYFIVRRDLDSMTCGRIAAQVSHAAHKFACKTNIINNNAIKSWEDQGQGCGTSIVLKTNNIDHLTKLVYDAQNYNIFADTYYDETYSVKDGEYTHLVSIITCGYVFIDFNNSSDCDFYDRYLKYLETL